MTRDKNSQKAEKKPHSTSEPVTQPQPVISAQSEYPQKARTASAQQPAQKIGSESSAQNLLAEQKILPLQDRRKRRPCVRWRTSPSLRTKGFFVL